MINFENWLFTAFFNLSNIYKFFIGALGVIALTYLANFIWNINSNWHSTLLALTSAAALITLFVAAVPLAFIIAMHFSYN